MCFFRCCPAARWCAHVLQYACGDGFINGARDVLQVGGGRLDWVRAAVYDCARFAVSLGIDNLLDRKYHAYNEQPHVAALSPNAVAAPERTYWLGFSFNF